MVLGRGTFHRIAGSVRATSPRGFVEFFVQGDSLGRDAGQAFAQTQEAFQTTGIDLEFHGREVKAGQLGRLADLFSGNLHVRSLAVLGPSYLRGQKMQGLFACQQASPEGQ